MLNLWLPPPLESGPPHAWVSTWRYREIHYYPIGSLAEVALEKRCDSVIAKPRLNNEAVQLSTTIYTTILPPQIYFLPKHGSHSKPRHHEDEKVARVLDLMVRILLLCGVSSLCLSSTLSPQSYPAFSVFLPCFAPVFDSSSTEWLNERMKFLADFVIHLNWIHLSMWM